VRAPIVALPAHGGVYAGGKLYLEGAVPDQAMADRLRSIAAAVVGPENVIGDYLVDPAAPRDSEGRVHIEDTILFAVGSNQVAPGYAPALQLLVKAMNLNPTAKLVIEGHTDIQGPLQLNLELSKARADAMVATLVQQGIDPARLVAVGKGPFLPRADNATEAGRAQNRRIELTFVGLLN
jgi:outer membrane protein OmpA-like peptidoglycan-associated protein